MIPPQPQRGGKRTVGQLDLILDHLQAIALVQGDPQENQWSMEEALHDAELLRSGASTVTSSTGAASRPLRLAALSTSDNGKRSISSRKCCASLPGVSFRCCADEETSSSPTSTRSRRRA